MDIMGKKIKQAYDEYDSLTSTRRRLLERPLSQIDTLRKERGILESPVAEDNSEFEANPESQMATEKTTE